MNPIQDDHLTNEEKTLVAIGAAMGAGCRTCADKLHGTAVSLKIPEEHQARACFWGLAAKGEAVTTMQRKAATLIDAGPEKQTQAVADAERFAPLVRIASFVAANSAPDALAEIGAARARGATADQIRLSISLGKMVRKNAMAFSDQELSNTLGLEEAGQEACCAAAPSPKAAPACSCS